MVLIRAKEAGGTFREGGAMTGAGPEMPLLAGARSQGIRQLLEAGKPGKSHLFVFACL